MRSWLLGRGWQSYVTSDNRQAQTLPGVTKKTASPLKNADWANTVHQHKADEAQSATPGLNRAICIHAAHRSIQKECFWITVRAGVAGTQDCLLGSPFWTFGVKWQGIMAAFWCALGITVFQVAGDYKYHPECFVCLSCRVVIEDQDTYALVERTKLYWWVTSHISPPNCTCIYCRLYWCRDFTGISSKL